jgi:hypothetical protein
MLVIFTVLYIAHWSGMFFYLCGFYYAGKEECIQEGKECGWLGANNLFIDGLPNPANERHMVYLNSLYWGTVTMMTLGYGDFTPYQFGEKLYTVLFLLIVVSIMYPAIIGEVTVIMNSKILVSKTSLYMRDADEYIHTTDIDHVLADRVRRHIQFTAELRSGYGENQTPDRLPDDLRVCVLLQKVPLDRPTRPSLSTVPLDRPTRLSHSTVPLDRPTLVSSRPSHSSSTLVPL